ncbi:MAG: LysM peptidoglycan-binding domain-containing protein [Clostridia bacterium]
MMHDSHEKMEISVITIPGVSERLVDNFFINGRTREWLDSSIINFVLENPVADGIFAVTSNMDIDGKEGEPSISFVKELRRFQLKYSTSGGELESKTNLLREQIAEVNNFIHSIGLVKEDKVKADSDSDETARAAWKAEFQLMQEQEHSEEGAQETTSEAQDSELPDAPIVSENQEDTAQQTMFEQAPVEAPVIGEISSERSVACVYVENGKYTMLSSGNAKVFVHSNGVAKQLTNAKIRIERLVKLGVMSENQAKDISNAEHDGISQFSKATLSSGDTLVLCTGGATEYIDEQKLSVILSAQTNLTTKSSDILKGAAAMGLDDDLTVMMIHVGASEKFEGGYADDFDEDENKFSGKIAAVFAGILALVIGLAVGYMVLPSVFGKKLVDVNAKYSSVSGANKTTNPGTQATKAPVVIQTETPVDESTPEPTVTTAPTAAPTPVLTIENGKQYYTVQPGDTFSGIAKKVYGNSSKFQIIMDANKGVSANSLKIGQKLEIPKLP